MNDVDDKSASPAHSPLPIAASAGEVLAIVALDDAFEREFRAAGEHVVEGPRRATAA